MILDKYIAKIICISFVSVTLITGKVRLKDLVSIENARQEAIVGYGLVVGLNNSGDRASRSRGAVFTIQTISNMLERFGITIPKDELRTRNVAAVMVTARTPSFGRVGSLFDVVVSSLGDATSLEGGILLMTPLIGNDGTYYGQAQGPVSIGGYNIETGAGEKLRKNHALVGRVPNGATLEKASTNQVIDFNEPIRFLLHEPDFVTVSRIADEINLMYGAYSSSSAKRTEGWLAKPINAAVVELTFPDTITTQEEAVFFIAGIETLLVNPDIEARVVINERTGTVVAGGNVKISEVMISHGSLTIHVRRTPVISQPAAAFSSSGKTVVEYITETKVEEMEAKAAVIKSTSSVSDLAGALNELGLRPRDIIAIFQAVKQAGALNARLIIM